MKAKLWHLALRVPSVAVVDHPYEGEPVSWLRSVVRVWWRSREMCIWETPSWSAISLWLLLP